jgi:hypothetical protein
MDTDKLFLSILQNELETHKYDPRRNKIELYKEFENVCEVIKQHLESDIVELLRKLLSLISSIKNDYKEFVCLEIFNTSIILLNIFPNCINFISTFIIKINEIQNFCGSKFKKNHPLLFDYLIKNTRQDLKSFLKKSHPSIHKYLKKKGGYQFIRKSKCIKNDIKSIVGLFDDGNLIDYSTSIDTGSLPYEAMEYYPTIMLDYGFIEKN